MHSLYTGVFDHWGALCTMKIHSYKALHHDTDYDTTFFFFFKK